VSQSALPIYICITEWGKKRLSEVFCYFEKYLMPEKFRILYSNVDNVILCLSTNQLEEAVNPKYLEKFLSLKSSFFSKAEPGHLKEEFVMHPESEWKFVSGLTHNYAILTNNKNIGVHKNSALKHVDTQQAYNVSLSILNHEKISVPQVRRTCKMAHLDTILQHFYFA
jgi:hypothetical protein